jgi:hypothetical protein
MAMLVWRVKLIAELESGSVSETEVARIEPDDFAVPTTLHALLDFDHLERLQHRSVEMVGDEVVVRLAAKQRMQHFRPQSSSHVHAHEIGPFRCFLSLSR